MFNVEFKLFQPFKNYNKPFYSKMCFEKPQNTEDLAAKWVQSWGHAKQCTDFHSHEELKQLVPKKMIKEELYLSDALFKAQPVMKPNFRAPPAFYGFRS